MTKSHYDWKIEEHSTPSVISIGVSETWNAGMTHATLEWQTQLQCFCNNVHCTAQYNKIYHVLLFSDAVFGVMLYLYHQECLFETLDFFLGHCTGEVQKEAVFITTRTFTHRQEVVANSTEQSPSLKANGHSACQEILVLIWNLKVPCGVHSSSKRVK